MLTPMKKFIGVSNMFLLNLPRHICENALLGQRNLVNAIKNGIRLALKLV
jgi:hypothetical protein